MVENLCYHKFAANLYTKLCNEIELHIKEELSKLFVYPSVLISLVFQRFPLTSLTQTQDNNMFLTLVDNCWQAHCSDMVI